MPKRLEKDIGIEKFQQKKERPLLTYFFIALAFLVYIMENIWARAEGEFFVRQIFDEYGFSLEGLLAGRWWTFFTSIFLHSGPEHLILNMVALFFFGQHLEMKIGKLRYAFVFFGTAIAGDLAVATASLVGIMPASIPTVGASAAIFGIMGAGMIINPFEIVMHPYLVPVPFLLVALIYTIYNISAFVGILATGTESNIAYIAHIGGILAGALYGFTHEGAKKGALVILVIFIILFFFPFILTEIEKFNYIRILENFFNR
ncbi:MAG TPA: rhomboid family intramembrane serine protease [archaeon]|nr:rhomboid family intramembrane serine protease [archaeon]